MSTEALFFIGIIVFAMTVYGSVMAGGLLLEREADDQDAIPVPDDRVLGARLADEDG